MKPLSRVIKGIATKYGANLMLPILDDFNHKNVTVEIINQLFDKFGELETKEQFPFIELL